MHPKNTPKQTNEQVVPYGYCHCGCGRKTNTAKISSSSKGWVKGEPLKFIRYHVSNVKRRNPKPWIVDDATGCWLYTGPKGAKGYGRIMIDRQNRLAHRHFYEQLVGPIPEGLQLDHLCRNTSCVNPDHLEPVTPIENIRRSEKIVMTSERKEIAKKLEGTMSYAAIAREIGVSLTTVWNFLNGRSWVKE